MKMVVLSFTLKAMPLAITLGGEEKSVALLFIDW